MGRKNKGSDPRGQTKQRLGVPGMATQSSESGREPYKPKRTPKQEKPQAQDNPGGVKNNEDTQIIVMCYHPDQTEEDTKKLAESLCKAAEVFLQMC